MRDAPRAVGGDPPVACPRGKVNEVFSNAGLKVRPSAFAEATTLIWLADAAGGASAAPERA